MAQWLNEHDISRRLGISTNDVVELIRSGFIEATKKNNEWLAEAKVVDRFETKWGSDVAGALASAHSREECDPTSSSPTASTFFVQGLRIFALALIAISILGIAVTLFLSRYGQLILFISGFVAGFTYLVFYDLILSIFAMRDSLERIANDIAVLRREARRRAS